MKPFLTLGKTAAIALLCAAVLTPTAYAQNKQEQEKKELATRIVNLQKQSQDMDALIAQLAGIAKSAIVEAWLPRLEKMPAARQKVAEERHLRVEPSLEIHGRPTKRDRRSLDRWRGD